jgi:hypothetical protein
MAGDADETPARTLLTEHAQRALIHELGTVRVDAWPGKDGLFQHEVGHLADIVVALLWPVLCDRDLVDHIVARHASDDLPPPIEMDPNDW